MGTFRTVTPPLPSVAVAVTVSVPAPVKVWVMVAPVGSVAGGVASPKSQATVTASPSASVVVAVKVCNTLA